MMKYILTEEEMEELTSKKDSEDRIKFLASTIEASRILILKLSGTDCQRCYCSDCPVSSIGDYPKDRIKIQDHDGIAAHKISKAICGLYRKYSK